MRLSHIPKLSYSIREAQLATGAGRGTIRGAIERGELAVKHVGPTGRGKKILITAESLHAWVQPEAEASQTIPEPKPERAAHHGV